MLSALTSYLQQQPVTSSDSNTAAVTPATALTGSADTSSADDLYAPSSRALLVSAVASDFDVHSLSPADTGELQQRLQQYGLVSTTELNAFSLINTARAEMGENDTLDAVAILDNARDQFSERGTAYTERQQINRLHTLVHNIASARVTQ